MLNFLAELTLFFCKFLVHSPCYYFWWYWLCLYKFSLAMLECNKLPNDSLICNHWMNVYDTFRLLLQSDLGSRFNIISHNYVIRKGTCFFVSVFFYDKLFFENLVLIKVWLRGQFKYYGDYLWRKTKGCIRFKI